MNMTSLFPAWCLRCQMASVFLQAMLLENSLVSVSCTGAGAEKRRRPVGTAQRAQRRGEGAGGEGEGRVLERKCVRSCLGKLGFITILTASC